jgi:glyoxylase-like metal-dependent hydrolase (beta-lactamase superfamily II)
VDGAGLYFRQMLSGRDFAAGDPVAAQMVNFAYAVGDRASGEVLLVDPAYAVADIVETVEAEGGRVVGVLATHHHADHVGGSLMGHAVEGLAELLSLRSVPVHAHRSEIDAIRSATGVSSSELVAHDGGDVVAAGAVTLRLVHTPGHTPGSQCFLVGGMLIAGDTLFLDGCGRTDLPGGDPGAMYDSLQLLAGLPDDTAVFPGHRYSAPSSASMDAVRGMNMVFKPPTKEAWLATFAGA